MQFSRARPGPQEAKAKGPEVKATAKEIGPPRGQGLALRTTSLPASDIVIKLVVSSK